ncbi:hypothetical protein FHETE_3276 [Fusarium heterosporum]|uniref:Uncharacterized protein n=1 Tax=Fusarium heterosporum TaxID=42747 RepID=A0A8H5TRK0_FUSHE|nr:hypothetical protein FHETE_3276 [Fusarium heterosporum]
MSSKPSSAKKKKQRDDTSCTAFPKAWGSKTPLFKQNMTYQGTIPAVQKSSRAKTQTPTFSRDRSEGPYIQYETPTKKATGAKTPIFDRTCDEEPPVRRMNLPNFTYCPEPLVMFSSDDVEPRKISPKEPREESHQLDSLTSQGSVPAPRGVEPSESSETSSSQNATAFAAAIRSVQEIARKNLSLPSKIIVIKLCLSMKHKYLKMPPAPGFDQEPFWAQLLEKLPQDIAANKFKVPKDVKDAVEAWCHSRRSLLREGALPVVSKAQPELDSLIDLWNEVFVERFCQVYRGYFESDAIREGNKSPEPRPSMDTRDAKVAFKIPKSTQPQKDTASLWTERREPRNPETNLTTTSSNLAPNTPPVQKKEELTRKRNISGTPESDSSPSREVYTSGRPSNDTGPNEPKRPRTNLEESLFVESNLPPTTDFSLMRRGQYSPHHRQPSPPRRSRWDRSDEKKTQNDPSRALLGSRTPGRPVSPEQSDCNGAPLGLKTPQRRASPEQGNNNQMSLVSRTPRHPPSPKHSNRNQITQGSRTPRRPSSPERRNRNEMPSRPRTSRRPISPGQRGRDEMSFRPRSPRRSVSPRRGKDTRHRQRSMSPVGGYREERRYADRWRPNTERPREWREDTVEFSRMPTKKQNISLRREMKEIKALLEKSKQ